MTHEGLPRVTMRPAKLPQRTRQRDRARSAPPAMTGAAPSSLLPRSWRLPGSTSLGRRSAHAVRRSGSHRRHARLPARTFVLALVNGRSSRRLSFCSSMYGERASHVRMARWKQDAVMMPPVTMGLGQGTTSVSIPCASVPATRACGATWPAPPGPLASVEPACTQPGRLLVR
jgi:hypothetical protein